MQSYRKGLYMNERGENKLISGARNIRASYVLRGKILKHVYITYPFYRRYIVVSKNFKVGDTKTSLSAFFTHPPTDQASKAKFLSKMQKILIQNNACVFS